MPTTLWTYVGLSSALSAWTKNEGLPFFGIVAVSVAACAWREARWSDRSRVVMAFAVGAAPILLVLLAFKSSVKVPNEMVEAQTFHRAMEMLFNEPRVLQVLWAFGREVMGGSGTATVSVIPVATAFVVVAGVNRRRWRLMWPVFLMIAAMALVDVLVYVLTPYDVELAHEDVLDARHLAADPIGDLGGDVGDSGRRDQLTLTLSKRVPESC